MPKIVINTCYGGFQLSPKALKLLGLPEEYIDTFPRDNEKLVQVVEKLGKRANTRYSNLKVVEVPDDVQWYIEEYDGMESVHEVHRIWS